VTLITDPVVSGYLDFLFGRVGFLLLFCQIGRGVGIDLRHTVRIGLRDSRSSRSGGHAILALVLCQLAKAVVNLLAK